MLNPTGPTGQHGDGVRRGHVGHEGGPSGGRSAGSSQEATRHGSRQDGHQLPMSFHDGDGNEMDTTEFFSSSDESHGSTAGTLSSSHGSTNTPHTSPESVSMNTISLDQYTGRHVLKVTAATASRTDPLDLQDLTLCGPLEITDIQRPTLPRLIGRPWTSRSASGKVNAYIGLTRGLGALWRVNSFHPTKQQSYPVEKLVLKIAVPTLLCDDYGVESQSYDSEQAASAVLHECWLLSTHMLHLQGDLIPRMFGIFVGKYKTFDAWTMIVEDGGEPIQPTDLTDAQKLAIVRNYERLHEHDILHLDCSLSNILHRINGSDSGPTDSQFYINDFERSVTRQQFDKQHPDDSWEDACGRELDHIHYMLGIK